MLALVEQRLWNPAQGLVYARAIRDADARARALLALAPYVPEALRAEVLGDALAAAQVLEHEFIWARVLVALAPHLPKAVLGDALAAAQELEHESSRAEVLSALSPRLMTLSHSSLHVLWSETLHALALRSRRHLMADLQALAPVMLALGGTQVLAEVAQAIHDVGRWWP